MEAFLAWTDPVKQRRGFASELLAAAVQEGPVFSDYQGMTEAAYALWTKPTPKIACLYFDDELCCFVNQASIPTIDLFTPWEDGRRWRMVLAAPSWSPDNISASPT
jgi:hypothetical protein